MENCRLLKPGRAISRLCSRIGWGWACSLKIHRLGYPCPGQEVARGADHTPAWMAPVVIPWHPLPAGAQVFHRHSVSRFVGFMVGQALRPGLFLGAWLTFGGGLQHEGPEKIGKRSLKLTYVWLSNLERHGARRLLNTRLPNCVGVATMAESHL